MMTNELKITKIENLLKDTLKNTVISFLAHELNWSAYRLSSFLQEFPMDSVMEEVSRLSTESESRDRFDTLMSRMVFAAALSAADLGCMHVLLYLWPRLLEHRSSAEKFEKELGINFEILEKKLNKDNYRDSQFQELRNKDPESCVKQPENHASKQIKLLRFIFEEGGQSGFALGPSNGKELLAAAVRYPETFVYLFENAPRYAPDPADRDGGKPLEIAASLGQIAILRILIEESSRYGFTIQNEDFVTAVGEGAANGHLSSVRYLIETGKKLGFQIHPDDGHEILGNAIKNGDFPLLRYLVEEAEILQKTPLILARDSLEYGYYDQMLPYLFDKCRKNGLFLDCRALFCDCEYPNWQRDYEGLYRQVCTNIKICTLLEQGTITRPEADLLYTSGAADWKGVEEMLEAVESKLLSVEEAVRALRPNGGPEGSRRGKI